MYKNRNYFMNARMRIEELARVFERRDEIKYNNHEQPLKKNNNNKNWFVSPPVNVTL